MEHRKGVLNICKDLDIKTFNILKPFSVKKPKYKKKVKLLSNEQNVQQISDYQVPE